MEPHSSSVTVPQAAGGESRSPVVSVCCATFNHRQYLQQALDGFLMQQTSFPFEVIVHDDASTDGTADIVREYALRHPSVFRPILQAENQYQRRVKIVTIMLPQARGKYIALCEGDDYWTDPLKLQKQVDALETHLEWSGCFHRAVVKRENTAEPDTYWPEDLSRDSFGVKEILERNPIMTASVMYRAGVVSEIPGWFSELAMGDWPLHLLHADWGPMGFLSDVMSVYRVHPGGVWSSLPQRKMWAAMSRAYSAFDHHFQGRYAQIIEDCRMRHVDWLCEQLEAAQVELEAAQVESAALRASWSYRIGKLVLTPALIGRKLFAAVPPYASLRK